MQGNGKDSGSAGGSGDVEVDNWYEKLNMLIWNMSSYYILSVSVSLAAVLLAAWYIKKCDSEIAEMKNSSFATKTKETSEDTEDNIANSSDSCPEDEDKDVSDDENDGLDDLQARYKTAKHQAIVDHLSSKMTPEQLVEEKNTEKAQLDAIFNLLKEQEEKFHVTEMSDLQDQLSLYR